MNKTLLVLSPHTDDETLGCGGLISKYSKLGYTVHVALFSHGGAGIKWQGDVYLPYSNVGRLREFYEALHTLSVDPKNVHLYSTEEDVIHHRMDMVPQGDLTAFIEKIVSEINPMGMFMPFAGYDQDHIAINHAAKVVARPHFYHGTVYEYGVGSESDFIPNTFCILDKEEFSNKIMAFNKYQTQAVGDSHLLSSSQIERFASRCGAFVNVDYAEGFICKRGLL